MAEEIVNLPSGGGDIDWSEIGYTETPQYVSDHFEYAKKIASEWDSSITDASNKYSNDKNLGLFPLVNTSNVTNMNNMFYRCTSLITIPPFDTSRVTRMYGMFYDCSSLTDIPQLNTSRVTQADYMFYQCSKLTTIPQLDMSNVNGMDIMLYGCYSLKSILMYGMKISFDISASTQFEESDLVTILNNLATVTSTKILTMGSTNLAKLTDEEKAIATNKGWTLK